jgi:hypothetical protein
MSIERRFSVGVIIAVLVCGWSTPAAASMNYSTYEDVWGGDPELVYGYAELDDLGGCAQYANSQTTYLMSPTRTVSASGQYSSSASMAYDAEEGNWSVVGNFSVQCNCAPFGGSHTFIVGGSDNWYLSHKTTFYKWPTPAPPLCLYATTACSSGTPTCVDGTGFNFSVGCPDYLQAFWLVATKGSTNKCLIAVSFPAGGPGHCS